MASASAFRGSPGLTGALTIALVVVLSACALSGGTQGPSTGPRVGLEEDGATLTTIADSSVFFGHQSVGMNILSGVTTVYSAAGLEPPTILESPSAPPSGAAFAHAFIGTNGSPSTKLAAFAAMLRDGMGDWADVAFMKLCYVDVVAGSDVDALFAEYRAMASELEAEFPDVTFLHMTVPLTTEPGLKAKVKNLIGRGIDGRADNVAREQYNSWIRAEYARTGRLVDVAVLESTTPDGDRVAGNFEGHEYFALYEGYAADTGHLNATGKQVVAEGLLAVIASHAED